jgi:magnesium transporter
MSTELQLAASFTAGHGQAAAAVLESAQAREVASFIESLDAGTAASLIGHLSPSAAARCIAEMDVGDAADLLCSVGHQRSVLVLQRMNRTAREAVVADLPASFAARVERHLRYPEGSAGWLADSSVDPLPENLPVAEARDAGLDPRFPYVYLVDSDQRLVGVVHIRDIIASPGAERLRVISKTAPVRISALADVADLRRHRAWADLDVLPVVDGRGRFIGALRHQALRRHTGLPSPPDGAGTPLDTILQLAELYWSALSSVFLPVMQRDEAAGPEERHGN